MSLKIFSTADDKLKKILLTIDSGANVILHSPGGTGKSWSLRLIASYLQGKGKIVACTATTGVAAVNLNYPEKQIVSSTLHSWAGVRLAKESAKKLCARICSKKCYRLRWAKTDVLIVDEVSMLGSEFVEKLDYIGKTIRKNDNPFGGIQIVFGGDFLQLPPVKDNWVFESQIWEDLNLVPFVLKEPKRYDDIKYYNILLRIRQGKQTQEDIDLLYKRVIAYDRLQQILKTTTHKNVIKPTIIYSRKMDVHAFNERELEKLPGETHSFSADDVFQKYSKDALKSNYTTLLDEMIPETITIKVGSQVMLKSNLDVNQGLVNGSRGVVTNIYPGLEPSVQVKFINGKSMRLTRQVYDVEDKKASASRLQLPVILAWALTVHKVQGTTLDFAICDLGTSIFTDGQAYVALSRVRNFKGLFISDLYEESFMTNKSALEFEKQLIEKEKNFQLETNIQFEEDDEPELPDFILDLQNPEKDKV